MRSSSSIISHEVSGSRLAVGSSAMSRAVVGDGAGNRRALRLTA
jgi:hypothetical protein